MRKKVELAPCSAGRRRLEPRVAVDPAPTGSGARSARRGKGTRAARARRSAGPRAGAALSRFQLRVRGRDALRLLRAVRRVGGAGKGELGTSRRPWGVGSCGLRLQLAARDDLEGRGAEWLFPWAQRSSWGGSSRPSRSPHPRATGSAGEAAGAPVLAAAAAGRRGRFSRGTLEAGSRAGEAGSAQESPQRLQARPPVPCAAGQGCRFPEPSARAPAEWPKRWPSGGARKSGGRRRVLVSHRSCPYTLRFPSAPLSPKAEWPLLALPVVTAQRALALKPCCRFGTSVRRGRQRVHDCSVAEYLILPRGFSQVFRKGRRWQGQPGRGQTEQ